MENTVKIEELTPSLKDELLAYAAEELGKTVPRTIKLSKLETFRLNRFCKDHKECGGTVTLKVVFGPIGDAFECECSKCKEYINITDVDSW
jgi:hypothetical protein